MTINMTELARRIDPQKTVLFLGAGASVPSGAPTGAQLAATLCGLLAGGEAISDDFMEVCSILENRYTRPTLVEKVRNILKGVRPTGGLLMLPEFNWQSIYTTNFDTLIEAAYRRAEKEITTIRSNFDYGKPENAEGVTLFKIHGCIGQDIVDNYQARMVLTERDYEEYEEYRETLFKRLDLDLNTKDVFIVGHSLRDPHLRKAVNTAADLHQKKGTPGRLYALIYETDSDRALLLERRGIVVAFGGIDEFLHELTATHPVSLASGGSPSAPLQAIPRLQISTIDVAHAKTLPVNASKLFNGSPASYADIHNNLTFRRAMEDPFIEHISSGSKQFLVLTGVAGVGKTTLGRRLLCALLEQGFQTWEHRNDFPFKADEWLAVERRLREVEQRGVLLIDECSEFQRQINLLAEGLAKVDSPKLFLVLTANSTQWLPRTKSPILFAKGIIERLSNLSEAEIEDLVNLVASQPTIRELVEPRFHRLSRLEQIRQLRSRCSADMYVCLKNIFATDALDTILLREYAELDEDKQDIYRYVAALEAAGTKVHRQLIIRTLNVEADKIMALLSLLEGLVEEYEIRPRDGIYGWETRHGVIARTIAQYKFSDQDELFHLFESVIKDLNPTIWVEMRTLRDICSFEFGIGRLSDDRRKIELYERLIKLAPGERIPRHRLIATLLRCEEIEKADQAIRLAEDCVGIDSPISRYRIRLAIQRAEKTEGLLDEDRVAMLREAQRLALNTIANFPLDKYAYIAYGEVGLALAERSGKTTMLDDAIAKMRIAVDEILDPQLSDALHRLDRQRRRFSSQVPKEID